MALHTRAEFARLIERAQAHINVALSRGLLIPSGDYIDDTIPQNVAYLSKYGFDISKLNLLPEKPKGAPIQNKKKVYTKKKTPEKIPKITNDQPVNTGGTYALDAEKKQADIDWKRQQIKLLEIKEAQLRGEAIPTSLVMSIISMLGQSFQTTYKNGANVLVTNMCHELKADPILSAKMKGQLVGLINRSHEMAIDAAKKALESAIEEFTKGINVEQLDAD